MPMKKVSKLQARASSTFDDDNDLLQSQKTTSSDEMTEHESVLLPHVHGQSNKSYCRAYAAAAKEMKVAWAKEMKEKKGKERKIIQRAEKELDKCIQTKQDEIESAIENIEKIYADFLLEYATVEDKQRKIAAEIIAKQKILIPLSVQCHQAIIALGNDTEDGQLNGMTQVRAACKDFADLAKALVKC
ncbi:hypothetical protein BJ138DRAFT_869595 [Hygrophoropsis aurantiaca]|uniref:Uncharacterized protein n=1 Tax=Hygrophoropsis aurantiaca TaxID=72124 RepID=A0ACB8AFX2_9AGAM|nr:hypothetical protein BJ138DRAFT_869595 [Hygrophoropsis aurantiaca]